MHVVVMETDINETPRRPLGVWHRLSMVCMALVAVASLGCMVAVSMASTRYADLVGINADDVAYIIAMLSCTSVGVLLVLTRPDHPVAWIFSALGMSLAIAGGTQFYALYGLIINPGSLPGAQWAALVNSYQYIVWFLGIGLACALTPTGTFLSSRWRLISVIMCASGTVWLATSIFSTGSLEYPFESFTSPLALLNTDPIGWIVAPTTSLLVAVCVVSLIVRFRRAQGDDRLQLTWLVVAAIPIPAFGALAWFGAVIGDDMLTGVAAGAMLSLLPIGAAASIVRYRLYDVDAFIARMVAWTLTSLLLACVFVSVAFVTASLLGKQVGDSTYAGTAATIAVLMLLRPVAMELQEVIDHRFARRRYESFRVITQHLAEPRGALSMTELLRTACRDETLAIAYPRDDGWIDEHGSPVSLKTSDTQAYLVRLERDGDVYACIAFESDVRDALPAIRAAAAEIETCGLRADLERQVRELHQSRARIAGAQAQERRRIERDLHDGVQQRLLGTAALLRAAILNGANDQLREGLEAGIRECRTAVVELRDIANGLHPTLVASSGLRVALAELETRLPITTDVDLTRERYDLDIETALWFVVTEAVSNAVKHAAATEIVVSLTDKDGTSLRVIVADDGCGGAQLTGQGLRGLADRIEALDGTFDVVSPLGLGTQVKARVPCES